MHKLLGININETLVQQETLVDFFARGIRTAKRLDQKKPVKQRRIISFEDPLDLARFLMDSKSSLMADIRKNPLSITKLAKLAKRSRAAVCKDIQELEAIGMVKSEYQINPGHGRCKIVTAVDKNPIHLQVQTLF